MDPIALLVLAAVAGVAGVWLWRRGRPHGEADESGARVQRADALDTVAGWPPEATRVLTQQERRAHSLLAQALPEHIVLAQVPVSRFIRVPTRNSYHEWMRRVGQLCADLVVCDAAAQVIAVVEVRRPPHKDSERTRKRHDRMDRVLRKAGVRVIEWNEEALPHRDAVREQIVPTPKGVSSEEGRATVGMQAPLRPVPGEGQAGATGRRGAAPSVEAGAPQLASVAGGRNPPRGVETLDDVLPGQGGRSPRRDSQGPAEPTPSTWFDELESDRMPLDRPKP